MIDLRSPAFLRDPFPTYRRLRDEAPFHFDPVDQCWFVSRHADIQAILRDSSLFSSENASFERSLLGADGPMHQERRRRILEQSRQWHRRWAEKIEADVWTLLQPHAGGEPFDAASDYAVTVGVGMLQAILGVASSEIGTLRHCSRQLLTSAGADVRGPISAYASAPTTADSLPNALRRAEIADDVIVDICMLLVAAAVQTTKNLIGSAILRLLASPETRQAVVDDDQALVLFLEEVLRFASPVQRTGRRTRQRFEAADVAIPSGSGLILLLGAGNRDESVFARGETFDRTRSPNPHLAFGRADHFCLGAQMARTEAFHAVRTLFARFPATTLAGHADVAVSMEPHPALWGPTRLMVRLAETAATSGASRRGQGATVSLPRPVAR